MPETVVHFQIRMPPSRHEQLASRAREEKSSLNALIVSILRDAVERREVPTTKAGSRLIPSA
ncbi:MAG: Arc family DNA-binding protein [Isosphaeraceae bacterium]